MIVRKVNNESTLLVGQTDHSRLAGQFAAHWGNATFAPLEPFESMARAAHFHDFGHLRYETSPLFNPETGGTPMFREVPTDAKRLEEYQWCSEWFMALDPYASFIVNMHRTGLSRGRYNAITYPKPRDKSVPPEIEAFIARNEAARAEQLAKYAWSPEQIRVNYRLLQVWDLMSLYFSCQDPYEDYIEPVPTSYDQREGEGVRMTLTPIGPHTVRVDPFPFDVNPCRFQLAARRLSPPTYDSREAFLRAYFQAPIEVLEYEIVGSVDPHDRERETAGLVSSSAA